MTTMIPTTAGTQTALALTSPTGAAGWKLPAFWTWGAAEWIVLAGATIAIASLARVIVHIIQVLRTPVRGRKRPPARRPQASARAKTAEMRQSDAEHRGPPGPGLQGPAGARADRVPRRLLHPGPGGQGGTSSPS